MSHTTFIFSLGLLGPCLLLLLGLQALLGVGGLKKRGWPRLLLLAVAVAGVLRLPIRGASIGDWVLGLGISFSMPLICLLAVAVWESEFRRKLLSRSDWTAAWKFGVVAGLGLYPFALGWGHFDPYTWGWSPSPLFLILAVLTAFLLWSGNRLGLLLLFAAVGYSLHALESSNYWDYLLDPFYCVASVAGLVGLLATGARGDSFAGREGTKLL
jgi:hypothetical protein